MVRAPSPQPHRPADAPAPHRKRWFARNRLIYNEKRRLEAKNRSRKRSGQPARAPAPLPVLQPAATTAATTTTDSPPELFWTRAYSPSLAVTLGRQKALSQKWNDVVESVVFHTLFSVNSTC